MTAVETLSAAFNAASIPGEPAALVARREAAHAAFGALGIPNPRREEEWRYTPTRALAKHAFAPIDAPGDAGALVSRETVDGAVARVVFVDGFFDAERSSVDALPAGVQVLRIHDALAQDEAGVLGMLTRERERWANGFAALHDAQFRDGVLIDVAADTSAGLVQVLHLASEASSPRYATATTLVRVARHSTLTVFESFAGGGGAPLLRTRSFHVDVAEGAKVEHVTLQDESRTSFHIGEGDVQVAGDATYASAVLSLGSALARDTLLTRVHGTGAHVALTALYAPVDGQTIDHHTAIDHRAQGTTSDQLYKGVLDGSGHGVFNGKIFVRQAAQQTAAEQMNRNLMLSRDARIDTKPQLEIFADDVRCTHGATIGQLDTDEMFYMVSRAIPPDTARRLLIQGFADETLERVTHDGLRAHLSERFASRRS